MSSTHYHEYLGKRKGFEASKTTPTYKKWRAEQWLCQNGRCAWCYDKIDLYSDKTVADHIKPLYYYGDNDFNNLVLSCWECNQKKGKDSSFEKPAWIKDNKYATREYDRPSAKIDDPNPYIPSRNIWTEREKEIEEAAPTKTSSDNFIDKVKEFGSDLADKLGVYSIGDFFALIFIFLFVILPAIMFVLMILVWLFNIGKR